MYVVLVKYLAPAEVLVFGPFAEKQAYDFNRRVRCFVFDGVQTYIKEVPLDGKTFVEFKAMHERMMAK